MPNNRIPPAFLNEADFYHSLKSAPETKTMVASGLEAKLSRSENSVRRQDPNVPQPQKNLRKQSSLAQLSTRLRKMSSSANVAELEVALKARNKSEVQSNLVEGSSQKKSVLRKPKSLRNLFHSSKNSSAPMPSLPILKSAVITDTSMPHGPSPSVQLLKQAFESAHNVLDAADGLAPRKMENGAYMKDESGQPVRDQTKINPDYQKENIIEAIKHGDITKLNSALLGTGAPLRGLPLAAKLLATIAEKHPDKYTEIEPFQRALKLAIGKADFKAMNGIVYDSAFNPGDKINQFIKKISPENSNSSDKASTSKTDGADRENEINTLVAAINEAFEKEKELGSLIDQLPEHIPELKTLLSK